MNVDFSKKTEGAAPVSEHIPQTPTPNTETAVATTPSNDALAFRTTRPSLKEIILPRINLVQNTGLLKNSFQPGGIVYGQSTVLYQAPVVDVAAGVIKTPGTAPLEITIIDFRPTRYVEKVPGGGKGMLCTTEEQVRACGGTLDYNEWKLKRGQGMKRFEYMADAMIVIARPSFVADDDTIFIYEVEGVKYALALWSMKGSAYTHAAKKVFFTARQIGCLAKGYPTFSYAVTTRKEPVPDGGQGDYFIPVCVPAKRNSPAFLRWIEEQVLAAPQRDAEAAE